MFGNGLREIHAQIHLMFPDKSSRNVNVFCFMVNLLQLRIVTVTKANYKTELKIRIEMNTKLQSWIIKLYQTLKNKIVEAVGKYDCFHQIQIQLNILCKWKWKPPHIQIHEMLLDHCEDLWCIVWILLGRELPLVVPWPNKTYFRERASTGGQTRLLSGK